jgi:hypothetical protein
MVVVNGAAWVHYVSTYCTVSKKLVGRGCYRIGAVSIRELHISHAI